VTQVMSDSESASVGDGRNKRNGTGILPKRAIGQLSQYRLHTRCNSEVGATFISNIFAQKRCV